MASPPPAGSPPSASMFENVASQPPPSMPPPHKVEDNDDKNTAPHVLDEMPELAHFKILDSEEHMNKYRKYEADFTGRLMAKYFSKQNFYGGNIFDDKMTIDGETILSSRWPCTRSFADPSSSFEGENNDRSTSET